MADVAATGSFGEQVAIMAGLRWQVFRNSLRTTSARLDLLAFLVATVLGSLFVVGVGIGLGFACYSVVVEGHLELLALPMLAVFMFWQFLPLLLATSTTSFDFSMSTTMARLISATCCAFPCATRSSSCSAWRTRCLTLRRSGRCCG